MQLLLRRLLRKVLMTITPQSKRLELRHWFYLQAKTHEKELEYIEKIIPVQRGIAIDVGANEGLYTYALSRYFGKVYAFEVNPDLAQDLAKDIEMGGISNVEVRHQGLSSKQEEEEVTLYIPIQNGKLLTGWASFSPDNCPGIFEQEEKQVSVCSLDSLHLGKVSFIKIDVEGHELEVLKGSLKTIEKDRPYILVEIKDSNLEPVSSWFESLSYRKYQLSDFIDVVPSVENYIFLPGNYSG
jgi:FkbM family methyltransferase